jgi:hypothetical protein
LADSFFYNLVGVWSSVIALSPHENRFFSFWWDNLPMLLLEKRAKKKYISLVADFLITNFFKFQQKFLKLTKFYENYKTQSDFDKIIFWLLILIQSHIDIISWKSLQVVIFNNIFINNISTTPTTIASKKKYKKWVNIHEIGMQPTKCHIQSFVIIFTKQKFNIGIT